MRTSTSSQGFTLIELLAVMLLIGLGLGVSLTVDIDGSPQQQKQYALLLANALELTAQEAVLDETVLGLDFFTGEGQALGYRWLQLREGTWHPHEPRDADVETVLPPEFSASLVIEGLDVVPEARAELDAGIPFAPEIRLLPTRELTPFTLSLRAAAGEPSVLTADLMGRIRVDADVPPPPR